MVTVDKLPEQEPSLGFRIRRRFSCGPLRERLGVHGFPLSREPNAR